MGVEKLADAAIQITTKKGVGDTPSWVDRDNAIGKASAAAALLVMISVNKFVMINNKASNIWGPRLSAKPMI